MHILDVDEPQPIPEHHDTFAISGYATMRHLVTTSFGQSKRQERTSWCDPLRLINRKLSFRTEIVCLMSFHINLSIQKYKIGNILPLNQYVSPQLYDQTVIVLPGDHTTALVIHCFR